ILPVPSRTYIINLTRRSERRDMMERLRKMLGVEWEYFPATESANPIVGQIISGVNTPVSLPFEWPVDDGRAPVVPFEDGKGIAPYDDKMDPLLCSTGAFDLTPYSFNPTEQCTLTPGRIACYHSHYSAIQHAASAAVPHVALFLEDDIDVESDIQERLASVWEYLPEDWDMLFLGHCWSDETHHGVLGPPSPEATTHLRPSNAPLCTHAYALSPKGLERITRDLAHPSLAYSRPIDTVFRFLIQNGRLNSFSITPSIVVQRKDDMSDV
ncbi:hypothetical protein FB45DRAFT_707001, partial [Roridomyces roridus]